MSKDMSKDNYENFVARQYAEITDSVSETEEPEICWCGAHYIGSPCSGDIGVQ